MKLDTQQLFDAIHCEDLEDVRQALQNGADVKAKDSNGYTSLYWAAFNCDVEIVKLLVDNGANVHEPNNRCTPLYIAVMFGYTEIAKLLVDSENEQDNNECTFLHYAAENGHTEVVKFLIDSGTNVKAKDKNGFTPLHRAAFNGCAEITKLLVDNGANVNEQDNNGCTSLHYAAKNSHTEVAKLLIDNGTNVKAKDNNGFTPLYLAAFNGHIKIINFLADRKNERDNNVHTILQAAIVSSNTDVAKLPIDNGANVEVKDDLALDYGHSGTEVKKLTKAKITDVNKVNGRIYSAAIALSALIITAAFLTQTYVILVALVVPAMIGLYGYNKGQKPDFKLQNSDIETIKAAGRVATT